LLLWLVDIQCFSWLLAAQKRDFETLFGASVAHSANDTVGDPGSRRIRDEERWIDAAWAWHTTQIAHKLRIALWTERYGTGIEDQLTIIQAHQCACYGSEVARLSDIACAKYRQSFDSEVDVSI